MLPATPFLQLLLLEEVLVMEGQLFPVLDACPCHAPLEMTGDRVFWLSVIALGAECGWHSSREYFLLQLDD